MFIGYYELNQKQYFNIYYKNELGYKEWCKDTFSPTCENIQTLDFKLSGKTYKEKQNCLVELAKDWQLIFSQLPWSYGELAEIEDYFHKNAKRYGCIQEFKENGIC